MKAAILVTGFDAQKFLQGQLTCDLNLLTKDCPLFGAHCNIKGRVEALYTLFLTEVGIVLVTEADLAQYALEKLSFYARFSKVSLGLVPLDPVLQAQYSHLFEAGFNLQHPRLHLATVGQFLPQELGLDTQNAISYTKGCYLGQEIIARLHYLGKLKKELTLAELEHSAQAGERVQHPAWGEIEIVDVDENGKMAWILCQKNA